MIYSVKPGDSPSSIALTYLGSASAYPVIEKCNPHIPWKSRGVTAHTKIYPGEKLLVPQRRLSPPPAESGVSLLIDGVTAPTPLDLTLTRMYDSMADIISVTLPLEDQFSALQPFSLAQLELFFDGARLFTGAAEKISYAITPGSRTITVTGRSLTYVLIKSNFPLPSAPSFFTNITLFDLITQQIAPIFGLDFTSDAAPSAPFPKIQIREGQTVFSQLAALARSRSQILTNTENGEIFLTALDKSKQPVFTFESGTSLTSISTVFNSSDQFGFFTGYGDQGEKGESYTLMSGVDEPSFSLKHIDSSKSSTLQQTLQFQSSKACRDAQEITLDFPSWTVPSSSALWRPGDLVKVDAADIGFDKKQSFVLRKTVFCLKGAEMSVKLSLSSTEGF